jgi:site-specific recombinase XerD
MPKPSRSASPSLTTTFSAYLDSVRLSRSANTARTYKHAMALFADTLEAHHLSPAETTPENLPEDAVVWLANRLKDSAPSTEQLYLTAVKGFYEYLAAENLGLVNLPRVRLLIKQRSRRPGLRLPQFPRVSIEDVLAFVNNITLPDDTPAGERLRLLRDRAFMITLADTGLRVHEACNLRRGDLDWNEGRAVIIGKGNKQAVVRFSNRSMGALREYLAARANLDGISGRPLGSLPLFARHDKGAGKKIKPMGTKTGWNIVSERVKTALGDDWDGRITPHSFRHYFVTMVLQGSGNLKLAQELARHASIAVTQRYAHLSDDELDQGYDETFNHKV